MPDRSFGPDRIRARVTPSGASLDVAVFVERLLTDVIASLTDPDGRFDQLVEVAQAGADGGPERLLAEQLVAELVDEHETRLPLYGGEVTGLADALRTVAAPRPVPSQREDGAA